MLHASPPSPPFAISSNHRTKTLCFIIGMYAVQKVKSNRSSPRTNEFNVANTNLTAPHLHLHAPKSCRITASHRLPLRETAAFPCGILGSVRAPSVRLRRTQDSYSQKRGTAPPPTAYTSHSTKASSRSQVDIDCVLLAVYRKESRFRRHIRSLSLPVSMPSVLFQQGPAKDARSSTHPSCSLLSGAYMHTRS